MQLILVRHPQPEVAPGLCYGRADVSTSIEAITQVATTLRAAGLPGQLPVYASPLARCATLAAALDVPVTLDARLAEMDFGAWELRSWDEISRSEIDAWSADLLHYHPGGGESVMDVAARVAGFYADLRRAAQAKTAQALVVCHAGTMRLLHSLHLGGTLVDAALRAAQAPHRIDYGEVMMLET